MSVRLSPGMVLGWLLVGALLPLAASGPTFTKSLKLRWAYAPSGQDHLRSTAHGFGLDLGWATDLGRVGVELGYAYRTGDTYHLAAQGEAPAGKQAVDPTKSGDSRRNRLDGFAVRLSLQRPCSGALRYQVGLQLGGNRFKHEYRGDLRSVEWNDWTENSWRDSYSGAPVEGGLKVSPYAGFAWPVSDRSSLECNLMLVQYTALDYLHRPGSGTYTIPDGSQSWAIGPIAPHNGFTADRLEKRRRVAPQVELAYVFHF